MVIQMLSMGLDRRWRRLVVGGRLRLFQMARPAWSTPTASASTSMLVVSATLPTSLSPSESVADTATTASSLLVLH